MVDQDDTYSHSRLLSIVPASQQSSLSVYPNPLVSGQQVTLTVQQATRVTLTNTLGRTLGTYSLAAGSSAITLPTLAPGVYLLTTIEGMSVRLVIH